MLMPFGPLSLQFSRALSLMLSFAGFALMRLILSMVRRKAAEELVVEAVILRMSLASDLAGLDSLERGGYMPFLAITRL